MNLMELIYVLHTQGYNVNFTARSSLGLLEVDVIWYRTGAEVAVQRWRKQFSVFDKNDYMDDLLVFLCNCAVVVLWENIKEKEKENE